MLKWDQGACLSALGPERRGAARRGVGLQRGRTRSALVHHPLFPSPEARPLLRLLSSTRTSVTSHCKSAASAIHFRISLTPFNHASRLPPMKAKHSYLDCGQTMYIMFVTLDLIQTMSKLLRRQDSLTDVITEKKGCPLHILLLSLRSASPSFCNSAFHHRVPPQRRLDLTWKWAPSAMPAAAAP